MPVSDRARSTRISREFAMEVELQHMIATDHHVTLLYLHVNNLERVLLNLRRVVTVIQPNS